MKRTKTLLVWLMFLSLTWVGLPLVAEDASKEKTEEKRFGIVILPVLFYMPETKFGGGVGGLITYRPHHSAAGVRPSSLYFYAIYTQLKQFSTQLKPELYFRNEEYLLTGKIIAEYFPDKFWGIGNDTGEEAEENFTPRTFSAEASFQKKIWPKQKLYAGVYGQFDVYKIVKMKAGGSLERREYPGSREGTTSSLGFILNWDDRDNIFFPTQGSYCQFQAYFSRKFLGSDFETTSVKIDLRTFVPLLAGHVLALQGFFHSVEGTPAFKNYAKLGGDTMMRGYYSGRYRDNCLLALQAEYRLPVWKRFGMAAFAGIGDVASGLGNFKLDGFKYSFGLGLRFKIAPKEGTNLRFDFAWGKGTSGFYFTAGEAF